MRHGGNLQEAREAYGDPDGGWLDLSTGINPEPYPILPVRPEAWTRLPDAGREAALVAAARRFYRVTPGNDVLAAPGTQALIQLTARLAGARTVGIVSPTYSEHAIAAQREGCAVVPLPELADDPSCQVIVVVNPNNPDCRHFASGDLKTLARRLGARGGHLVVDEAFADAQPAQSLVSQNVLDDTIVLRSFGKFFGLAGVRLGFAVGPPRLIAPMAAWLGPWAVSGPAIEIGVAALSDDAWCETTRASISDGSAGMCRLLSARGFELVGSAGLFVLATHPRASDIHEALARRGILTRRFVDHPSWLRFGLADDRGSVRLDRALAEITTGPA